MDNARESSLLDRTMNQPASNPTAAIPPPTPEAQVEFLRNIQRLLIDGQFTASYKFALLHAIADLCVIQGNDSGDSLELELTDIAEKFIELYWQQSRPFELGGQSMGFTLQQNTGRQAAVIASVLEAQQQFGGSLFKLKLTAPDLWLSLLASVKRVVNEMPLWKLQTVGTERLDFLYDNLDRTVAAITLKPRTAYCFRAFYGLIRELVQGAWVRFVQRLNANNLGGLTDLGTFLFDQERGSLEPYKAILLDFQRGQCFYCGQLLNQAIEVDHFVPWSRYPTDLGHNFVLAHSRCNNAKSDHLAAEPHLLAWTVRNRGHDSELLERLHDAGLPANRQASFRIAEWAYEQAETAKGQVWLSDADFRFLSAEWRRILKA
jgi:5-methylcytosine-specific restriction endonuclease McrA